MKNMQGSALKLMMPPDISFVRLLFEDQYSITLGVPKQTAQRVYKRYLDFEGSATNQVGGDKRSLLTQEHF